MKQFYHKITLDSWTFVWCSHWIVCVDSQPWVLYLFVEGGPLFCEVLANLKKPKSSTMFFFLCLQNLWS